MLVGLESAIKSTLLGEREPLFSLFYYCPLKTRLSVRIEE